MLLYHPRQDLPPFWCCARDACLALGPQIDPVVFGAVHIERIAPVILGEPVWNLLENGLYAHWEDFVVAVEEAYGLTREQCIEGFFEMRPTAGEATHQFWLRVEAQHTRLGISEAEVFRHFVKGALLSDQEK